MSKPDFPKPYTPLTPNIISRIRSEQEYYDRDPERAEREQRARAEREREEREREEWEQASFWERMFEEEQGQE